MIIVEKICGIYKIENLINHKVYIGQSIDISGRWVEHQINLRGNKHASKHLQNAWNKYGGENFSFEIVERCSEEDLTEREQYWIDFYGGINSNNNYNSKEAGNSGKFSEETKKKLSDAHMGKNKGKPIPWLKDFDRFDPEYRKKLSQSLTGKKKSKKHAQHISEGRKGIVFSEEQRKKIGDSKRGVSTSLKGKKKFTKDGITKWVAPEDFELYKNEGWQEYHTFNCGSYSRTEPWNKGVPCSEETKEKLRKFNLGKKLSKETCEKMSKARKGTIYVNNGIKNKCIAKEELEAYLQQGWIKGGKKRL